MARRFHSEPRVQQVVQRLVALYLSTGSVNAMAEVLARGTGAGDRADGRIHPNRIHGLLAADPSRGVNDSTLEALERAIVGVEILETGKEAAHASAAKRAAILERVQLAEAAGHRDAAAIAEELGVPPAVVISVAGWSGPALGHGHGQAASSTTSAPASRTPDWYFQDVLYKGCRFALHRTPGRKVGLVIPTGGGKTRVALRIVLGELHDATDRNSVVLWVTHRKRLAIQARRELQKMVTNGTPELPEDAVALLANRVRFTLTTNLADELAAGRKLHMVVVDEAHHAAAPSYKPIFDAQPSLPGLFLTATPRRRDERLIGIDEVAYPIITYRNLFERSVLVEPTFDTYLLSPDAWDSEPSLLADFADYLLDRSQTDFVKTLVVASTVERLLALHTALARALASRGDHILTADDIAWVHGNGSSTGATPDDFLDEFAGRARGILVSTGSLLGEGFDDPSINAVVVTFPSTSLVQLMQTAGRALRFAPGKRQAFVIQVKESPLAYHFEQRWLYREISDVLHPQLVDMEYGSLEELRRKIEELLVQKNVRDEVRAGILSRLASVLEGETCSVLLTGLPYAGTVSNFEANARWSAVLETSANSELFRQIFNEFCEREVPVKDETAYLKTFLPVDNTPGSEWKGYINMLLAMGYARREIDGHDYDGCAARPYVANQGTTWLTYVTFTYVPAVPSALREFLRPCVNAERVLADYAADPGRCFRAVRLALPLGGAIAWLLDSSQAEGFDMLCAKLVERLRAAPADEGFFVIAEWRASLPGSVLPLALLDRIERFLTAEDRAQDMLVLQGSPRAQL